MAKLSLTAIQSAYASKDALNANFDAIEVAMENTLSRDGTTPNTMSASLDMNSNDILNVDSITCQSLTIDGTSVSGLVDNAETAATAAAASAVAAASSASAASGSASAAAASATAVEDAKLVWKGAWNSGTAYVLNDAVGYGGSSWICTQAHTNQTPADTAYWDYLAEKGASGAGTGDVVGPASATSNSLARFDGTTGKLLKDGAVIGTDVQAYHARLADIAGLTPTDDGVILGNGSNFVVESGATLKTSLGLTIGTNVQAYSANISTTLASQAEMEAGTEAAIRTVSPLRVAQAIAALGGGGIDYQTFSSSGTWTKPSTGTLALVEIWGGGGSGAKGAASAPGGGGGGGAYNFKWIAIGSLGATETVTIGAGGASVTSATTSGNAGGSTTFGAHLTAYGGGGGGYAATGGGGGGGGGHDAVGASSTGALGGNGGGLGTADSYNSSGTYTEPMGGDPFRGGARSNGTYCGGSSFFGGGGGGYGDATATLAKNGGGSIYGGGGGAAGLDTAGSAAAYHGGNSVYGGGGGGAGAQNTAASVGGTSKFGGNGGNGAIDTNAATAGSAKGGGGGGAEAGDSGAGGDGYCQVTVF